ncbi:MAG TPA: ADP-ribosylation factor-like protein [Candidatus Bathyarchaeia archaeon]|nr:ADP-ribosylation factor-like protein [Candidatus Bathyarchaeia archaeon]
MSAIKNLISKYDQKISIAIIGLINSGKTEFVKRILQTDESILATLDNSTNFELQIYGNLSLLTWDLIDVIPQDKSLWKRSILGADAIFYIIDSTDPASFDLNKQLIDDLIRDNYPMRLLIIANKADLPSSISIGEIIEALDLFVLDKTKCECDLFKFSAKTGEGMYTIEEWLNKTLFKQKERIIDYIKIAAGVILSERTSDITEVILDSKPTLGLITTIHELKRKVTIFSRTMRSHVAGEEVIEISKYKVVLVKGVEHVVALVINLKDSVPRTIEIAKSILTITGSNSFLSDAKKLAKTIRDLYPLDIA